MNQYKGFLFRLSLCRSLNTNDLSTKPPLITSRQRYSSICSSENLFVHNKRCQLLMYTMSAHVAPAGHMASLNISHASSFAAVPGAGAFRQQESIGAHERRIGDNRPKPDPTIPRARGLPVLKRRSGDNKPIPDPTHPKPLRRR